MSCKYRAAVHISFLRTLTALCFYLQLGWSIRSRSQPSAVRWAESCRYVPTCPEAPCLRLWIWLCKKYFNFEMRKKPNAVSVIGGHQWTIVFDHFGIDVSTSFSQYSEKPPPSVKVHTSLLSSLNVVFLPMSELLNTIEY